MYVWDENESLKESRNSLVFVAAYGDSERVLQTGSLKTFDLGAHSCGEEVCTSLSRDDLEDIINNLAEVEIE